MKTLIAVLVIGFVLFIAALIFHWPGYVAIIGAGVLFVGFVILAIQGSRIRRKTGWKPIEGRGGVLPQARVVSAVILGLGMVAGIVLTIQSIVRVSQTGDAGTWTELWFCLALTVVAAGAFAYFLYVARHERAGRNR